MPPMHSFDQEPLFVVEVSVDSVESLESAVRAGATRIELCSALELGGLTPSVGLMKHASLYTSSLPIHCMIRPRPGDFVYSPAELQVMKTDMEAAAKLGLQGVVWGALTPEGELDIDGNYQLMQVAKRKQLDTTFHRALDSCPPEELEANVRSLVDLGFDRILSSGLAPTAMQGLITLQQLVDIAQDRIQIMAGSGIDQYNVNEILESSGVTQIHVNSGMGKGRVHGDEVDTIVQAVTLGDMIPHGDTSTMGGSVSLSSSQL